MGIHDEDHCSFRELHGQKRICNVICHRPEHVCKDGSYLWLPHLNSYLLKTAELVTGLLHREQVTPYYRILSKNRGSSSTASGLSVLPGHLQTVWHSKKSKSRKCLVRKLTILRFCASLWGFGLFFILCLNKASCKSLHAFYGPPTSVVMHYWCSET